MMGLLRGLSTLVLLLVFLGVIAWAWSGRRKQDFEALARLPLDPDPTDPGHVREVNNRE